MKEYPKCPQCNEELNRVRKPAGSMLNSDQFDAIRAGDWYCDSVPSVCPPQDPKRGSGALRYWWDREVKSTTVMQPQSAPVEIVLQPTSLPFASLFLQYAARQLDLYARCVGRAIHQAASDADIRLYVAGEQNEMLVRKKPGEAVKIRSRPKK